MQCPRCQHENEAGAKFCEECAALLTRACAKCGRPLSPTAKFCPECAHPTGLAAASPSAQRFDSPEAYTPKHLAEKILTYKRALEGERKQVTVLFADLKTFSGSCQAIFFGRCRSCCRAIVARWYVSSYGTWRSHRTKMIFSHFAPSGRSASRWE